MALPATPVLLERHLPEPISAHIVIARPDNAMAALADRGAGKDSRIAHRAQALQSKHGFVQINAQRFAVHPPHEEGVGTRWAHPNDTDRVALAQHTASCSAQLVA